MSMETDFAKLENLESMIFSLLTKQKTIVVGPKAMSEGFISKLKEVFPAEMINQLSFGKNNNTLSEEFDVSTLEMNEDSMKILDKTQGKYAVIFLPSNQIFGQNTSPFCKKIAALLKENKIESLNEEIKVFLQNAIDSEEILPFADYAAIKGMNKADASLMMWIRANYYKKEIDESLFKNEEW
jgi:hypothetical protein